MLRGGLSRVPLRTCVRVSSAVATSARTLTTGENYSYKPGPIARGLRRVFTTLTPTGIKKRIAMRMQRGMEKTEAMEREQMWLKTHGSPLQVMGLPDHAELPEVRARYRALVLETHPDTASASRTGESDYAILQTAYKLAINPNSVWHRNGAAPTLYRELLEQGKHKVRVVNKVRVLAVFSYILMGLIGVFFATVVVSNVLEAALKFFDPDFYNFMVDQEKEELRKRMIGETVDKDPKRLAPTAVRKLLYPGRYIHGDKDE